MTVPTRSAMSALVRQNWASAFVPQNWAPSPRTSGSITYQGPGIGEIKPHTGERIRAGLVDLQTQLAEASGPSQLSLHMKNKRPWMKGMDVVLLTYVYRSPEKKPAVPPATRELDVSAGRKLTVFALRPTPELLQRNAAIPKYSGGRVPQQWLDGLGTWYGVRDAELPSHSYPYWLTALGPTGRGTAFEPAVRHAFIQTIKPKGHLTWVKYPNTRGSDVVWEEIAEFLHEVVDELTEGR